MSLDELRIRMEGDLELLEAARDGFGELATVLAADDWERALVEQPTLASRLLADLPRVDRALAKARTHAELGELLVALDERQGRADALARQRLAEVAESSVAPLPEVLARLVELTRPATSSGAVIASGASNPMSLLIIAGVVSMAGVALALQTGSWPLLVTLVGLPIAWLKRDRAVQWELLADRVRISREGKPAFDLPLDELELEWREETLHATSPRKAELGGLEAGVVPAWLVLRRAPWFQPTLPAERRHRALDATGPALPSDGEPRRPRGAMLFARSGAFFVDGAFDLAAVFGDTKGVSVRALDVVKLLALVPWAQLEPVLQRLASAKPRFCAFIPREGTEVEFCHVTITTSDGHTHDASREELRLQRREADGKTLREWVAEVPAKEAGVTSLLDRWSWRNTDRKIVRRPTIR